MSPQCNLTYRCITGGGTYNIQLFKKSDKVKYIEIINVFLPTVQCWEGGG